MKEHYIIMLFASICLLLNACSDCDDYSVAEPNNVIEDTSLHTVKMNFICAVKGYDDGLSKSKAASYSWNDGDKVFITFYNGVNKISGEAIYDKSSGWTVYYNGNLASGNDLKCETRYFVNAAFSSSSLVSLTSDSEIYEDVNAHYTYNNGTLAVQSILSPKTGRIRFTGTPNETIHITGITVYTAFVPTTNSFSISNVEITTTITSNKSTPYIYGFIADTDRKISLICANSAYSRTCSEKILKAGESGYMSVPTGSSHYNWENGIYVNAKGVNFKMIPVVGYSEGYFLIGETEVTKELFYSVNGGVSSSQLPVYNLSYKEINAWINKLNSCTKLNFSLPTGDQWVYAAKGGDQSQNFVYSGSNTADDVAWYSGNTDHIQNVKTKAPNELGIFDMSGNVSELTSTIDTISMTISDGIIYQITKGRRLMGGSYLSKEDGITSKSSGYRPLDLDSQNMPSSGFRLILMLD